MNIQASTNLQGKIRPVAQLFVDYTATSSTASGQMVIITPIDKPFSSVADTLEEDHSWFWSEGWQQGERRADELYRQGKITKCATIDEVIALLRAKAK